MVGQPQRGNRALESAAQVVDGAAFIADLLHDDNIAHGAGCLADQRERVARTHLQQQRDVLVAPER